MTRICPKCGSENKDEYKHCLKCGTSLISIPKKYLIIIYFFTILLSWGGLLLPKSSVFNFIGVFFPLFIIQTNNSQLKKHGYILILISLIGLFLTAYFKFI